MNAGERIFDLKAQDRQRALLALGAYLGSLPQEKEYVVEVKEYRPRRSLDANAYCWVLLDKLAEKTGIPKSDIYRSLIREIGGNSDVVCCKNEAVDKLREGWHKNGVGWQTDVTDSKKTPGCKVVTLYYGSSTYDTRQMSRLIDLVVQECQQQGIETKTPRELALLKEEWEQ